MSRNDEVADLFDEFADLLEAQDVEYKPRAYRNAAENIRELLVAIEGLAADGPDRVAEIDAVGDAISAKIVEYVETGEIAELAAVREELPVEMEALTRVEGVGPKTVGTLYEELGVQTLADLEAAAEAGEIQELYGFGATTEQNILEGVDFAREAHGRELLARALPRADQVLSFLDSVAAVEQVELGGSIRRRRATGGGGDGVGGGEGGPAGGRGLAGRGGPRGASPAGSPAPNEARAGAAPRKPKEGPAPRGGAGCDGGGGVAGRGVPARRSSPLPS